MKKKSENINPEIASLKAEVSQLEDQLKRTLADYQNLLKRQELQKLDYVKFANESLLSNLLPILDDLDRAADHIDDTGLQMVRDHLYKALESEGLKKTIPQGETFDHQTMDCVSTVKGPQNQVVSVLSPGYFYHDRLLRPAKVEVGQEPTQK